VCNVMEKVKEEEYRVIELTASAIMKAVEPGNMLSDILSNSNRMLQSLYIHSHSSNLILSVPPPYLFCLYSP
jgi:hypothetical protein